MNTRPSLVWLNPQRSAGQGAAATAPWRRRAQGQGQGQARGAEVQRCSFRSEARGQMPITTESVLQPFYGSLGRDFCAISAGSATSTPACWLWLLSDTS